MTYTVKEIYYTLQGEGAQVGRAAVFLRFAGCNLWNGKESGRDKAVCKFCDTQFVGTDGENGGKFKSPTELAAEVRRVWDEGAIGPNLPCQLRGPYVVCTGGEPLLQLDSRLISALHKERFKVAVETNGTIRVPLEVDWICVSPKANSKLVQVSGHELKLVYPQKENSPEEFEHLRFDNFFLSPRDRSFEPISLDVDTTQACIEYCLANPQWRLNLQTHKLLGLK